AAAATIVQEGSILTPTPHAHLECAVSPGRPARGRSRATKPRGAHNRRRTHRGQRRPPQRVWTGLQTAQGSAPQRRRAAFRSRFARLQSETYAILLRAIEAYRAEHGWDDLTLA